MIEELHVRDLALISDVWLEFGPGMTALTGETGAGKTALLGALKLLLGERGDAGAVRAGASETMVEGRFAQDGTETLAKRRVSADGRSRCTLDGEMATVGALAEALGPRVDLHGQHEHQALLSATTHTGYLDRWARDDATGALSAYREALAAYREAVRARDELSAHIVEASRDSAQHRFVAEEIGLVAPVLGEDEELEARLPALQHGEQLAEAANDAATLLRGEGGAIDGVAQAAAALARVAGIDPQLDALSARLAENAALLDDVSAEVRTYRDGIEHDPDSLDRVLERLGELRGLTRKYGPGLADAIRAREVALEALAASEGGGGELERAQAAVDAAEGQLRDCGARLDGVRTAAAPGFVSALAEAVVDLAMSGARFEVSFAEQPFAAWTADGPSRVEFLYAPAPGQPARPLAKIASGGELSRVMLALKGVLGEADTVTTLVFDEVDAGIGGATAHAVGARLSRLSRTHQVIVVTHLAQVAAYADSQLVVEKSTDAETVATTVRAVRGDERVAEIARMLSGNDSDASLAHARELLESASSAV